MTTTGTSLLDLLGNVPSVTTDVRGNVSLRGSQAVRILIDGKPSTIYRNGSAALRSLPANMIAEVQVITNPSASSEAEGSAGILNIVLKKREGLGLNGSVSGGTALPANHELAATLNYRRGRVNWFVNASVGREKDLPRFTSVQRYTSPDTSYAYRELTTGSEAGYLTTLRSGVDLHLTEAQTLTASAGYFAEYKQDRFDALYTDLTADEQVLQQIQHDETIGGGEQGVEASVEYTNELGEDHELTAEASFEYGREPERPTITETPLLGTGDPLLQRIDDVRDARQWLLQVDYTRPLGEDATLEAGVRGALDDLGRDYLFEERQQGVWVALPSLSNNYSYLQNVNAAYVQGAVEAGRVAVQGGLRAERAWLRTRLDDTGATGRQSYLNLFPSVFLTYAFSDARSVQASYSRRIFRPRASLLLPFTTYRSSRSRFTGNPDLRPEFADAFEAGVLQHWTTGSLLASVYYRHRTDVVERITTLDDEGLSRLFPINLSTEDAWGLELTADQDVAGRLTLSGSANLFRAASRGTYLDQLLTSETRTLNGRLAATWQPADAWKAQASLRLRGPARTTQGRRAATGGLDIGVAHQLLDGRATLSLNVQDVFQSRRDVLTLDTPSFSSRQTERETTRMVRVNLLYRINQGPEAEADEDE